MSISGPLKIINDGLTLALDVSNSKSYPRTGSAWYDLISGSNNAALTNGAYYTSSYPQFINFDGINDYANFSSSVYPVSSLGFTVEVVGAIATGSNTNQRFVSKGCYRYSPGYFLGKFNSNDGKIRFACGIGSATSLTASAVYCYTSQSYSNSASYHLSFVSTGTYAYLYVDGEKSSLIKATGTAGIIENNTDVNYSSSASGLSVVSSDKFSVGSYINSNASIFDDYLHGRVSTVKVYNRALSYSEILINYSSIKNKYFSNFDELVGVGGDSITISGNLKIHTFTTTGTASFTLFKSTGMSESVTVEYLIVGGGGGGGMDMGGGGGGGGVLSGMTYVSTPYTATVIVGAGGIGAPAAGTSGQPSNHQFTIPAKKGDNSVFATFTAIGGGFGGSSYYNYAPGPAGGNGGSGGGASGYSTGGTMGGGTGTAGQGNNGGRGGGQYYSGGGGGAGGAGVDSTSQPNGGVGVQNSILGVSYFWGGGGGGASYSLSTGGNGGNGGGGGGAVGTTTGGSGLNNGSPGGGGSPNTTTNTPGGNGGANTGGGGGGGSHYNANNKGGNGGSGIVIIKYRYQ
jgi:hypothetical protein